MGLPFVHATESVAPSSVLLDDQSRIILSQYRSFESALNSNVLSLKYVVEGMEEYQVNGRVYQVKEGQFILVQPNSDVKVAWTSSNHVTGVCVYFDHQFSEEVLSGRSDLMLPEGIHVADRRFREWYELYIRGKASAEDAWWAGASLTRELFQEHQLRFKRLGGSRPDTKIALLQSIHQVCEYIKAQPFRPFNLEELAGRACLSKFHFLRTFRLITGITPQKYYQRVRFEQACELLLKEGARIQEVAWEIGFHEVAAFSKFFKKQSGLAPSIWKESMRVKDGFIRP